MTLRDLFDNDWWSGLARRAETGFSNLQARCCARGDAISLGPVRGGDAIHWGMVNLLLCVPYFVFDVYWVRVLRVVARLSQQDSSALLEPHDAVEVPILYPAAHAVFLLATLVPRSKLPAVIMVGLVAGSMALGVIDLLTVASLAVFVTVVYLIARSGFTTRAWKLAILVAIYLVFMNACQWLGSIPWPAGTPPRLVRAAPNIVGLSRFAPGFVPLIWYACYEACAGRLTLATAQAYFFGRLFMAPVFPVKDLRFDFQQRRMCQWRGLHALLTVFVAIVIHHHLEPYCGRNSVMWQEAVGGKLLGLSFLYYVYECCSLIFWFNLFIGWARLFGIPIRSAFHYWLLARTPNERWRRWNLLFREWIITYVFYPMMRGKKGLFLSIMATLMLSGVIHLLGSLTWAQFDLARTLRVLAYWAVNGLAIYVVVLIPRKWPDELDRLKVRTNVLWSLAGITFTASLYSILYMLRDRCTTWTDMGLYLHHLVGW